MVVTDSRLPLDTNIAPIKITDPEDIRQVSVGKDKAEELNNVRMELGRLMQVEDNLVNIANKIEKEMRDIRDALASKYGVTDGRWVIDFEENTLVKLEDRAPNAV